MSATRGDAGTDQWRPTGGLLRSVVLAVAATALGVVFGSPALVVLGAPFAVLAAAGLLTRPHRTPVLRAVLDHVVLHEGQGTASRLVASEVADVEFVTRAVGQSAHVALRPSSGVVGALLAGTAAERARALPVVGVSPRRWGRRPTGVEHLTAFSTWAGFRYGPHQASVADLTALPATVPFDARGEAPLPRGVVGVHRARREGSGVEFSGVRAFHTGDRLRRIDWRVSLRTGDLHVVTTRAELDTAVLLLLDSYVEHGRSGGVDGTASSLDIAVRAAAGLAEHFVRIGDRVGLRVLGAGAGGEWGYGLEPMAGRRQLRRIQISLARLRGAGGRHGAASEEVPRVRHASGTMVVVLSPMLDSRTLAVTAGLARRGAPVLVIDTLPIDADEHVAATMPDVDPRIVGLGWRLRALERTALLERLSGAGVPVVAWRGPGTLDEVLKRMARR